MDHCVSSVDIDIKRHGDRRVIGPPLVIRGAFSTAETVLMVATRPGEQAWSVTHSLELHRSAGRAELRSMRARARRIMPPREQHCLASEAGI